MRTQQEMFGLILDIAATDDRVRAVYINGSRTNVNVPKDKYQDFDIVFVVSEMQSFLENKSWVSVFGEIAILQEPYSKDFGWGIDHNDLCEYTWLMLFKDGNRIDLSIKILEYALENYKSDTLCEKLLDKDNILPQIPKANDRKYWIKPPTRQEYDGCCNEFWWCLNNIAKGIVRDQVPYALGMYYQTVHIQLEKMIEWYIGTQNNFSVATGMCGKYFKKFLPPKMYKQYICTYPNGNLENIWEAISTACIMFGDIAVALADGFGYTYNAKDADNMLEYIRTVKKENYELT